MYPARARPFTLRLVLHLSCRRHRLPSSPPHQSYYPPSLPPRPPPPTCPARPAPPRQPRRPLQCPLYP